MLSSLINGKTVSLTKIVNFVLCVCMCTLSLTHTLKQVLTEGRGRRLSDALKLELQPSRAACCMCWEPIGSLQENY